MPLRLRRRSASPPPPPPPPPDVIRVRDLDQQISGRKIPSLTEINLRPELDSPRFSFDSNGGGGSGFGTFRGGGLSSSISSPNLIDSRYSKKSSRRNDSATESDFCPICSLQFSDHPDSRVPRILPCLHTVCTGCLQRAEHFLVFLAKSASQTRQVRYSWRRRSARALLGNFICPFCHGTTTIFPVEGIRAFPVNRFISSKFRNSFSDSSSGTFNRQRLVFLGHLPISLKFRFTKNLFPQNLYSIQFTKIDSPKAFS